MQLRKHQSRFNEVIQGIIEGSPVRNIYVPVVPGGGKSILPILACKLIPAGLADRIAWVVPRLTLAHQAELNYLDPAFRKILGHSFTIRSSTNEINPCRGQHGFVTTWAAIGLENHLALEDFRRYRYILVCDEWHHAEDGGVWHKAIQPLVDAAAFRVFLSGTLERGDGKKIAFLPYRDEEGALIPDLRNEGDSAVVSYSRTEALREKAILPLNFILSDGHVTYEKNGRKISRRLSTADYDTGAAIYTALETEFAERILKDGLNHWQTYRARNPRSKVMVVTANIQHGRKILKLLSEWGYRAEIATSDDTPAAIKTLDAFRGNKLDICVSVAMCSEGYDCQPLTHIISLTHIRSRPWIIQMVSRAVRPDPLAGPYHQQRAYIFAPDDPLFCEVIESIKKEQLPFVLESESSEPKKKGDGNGDKEPSINPLAGEIIGTREIPVGQMPDGEIEETPLTIHEQEERVLHSIEIHVRKFAFDNRYKPQRISAEVKEQFGKSRRHMTLEELRSCLRWVRRNYPISGHSPEFLPDGVSRTRGSRQRVPTKAQPWNGTLFGGENGT